MRLNPKTPLGIVPVTTESSAHREVANYLTEQFVLAATRQGSFRVLERDLAALAQEKALQLSALFDGTSGPALGKLAGAEVMIVAKLVVTGGEAQLYARLLRVETGEILSAAKVSLKGGII
jgi:curli biogenesis system outer membrane secretion channel CsgG